MLIITNILTCPCNNVSYLLNISFGTCGHLSNVVKIVSTVSQLGADIVNSIGQGLQPMWRD
jgi:hypothetical protein